MPPRYEFDCVPSILASEMLDLDQSFASRSPKTDDIRRVTMLTISRLKEKNKRVHGEKMLLWLACS